MLNSIRIRLDITTLDLSLSLEDRARLLARDPFEHIHIQLLHFFLFFSYSATNLFVQFIPKSSASLKQRCRSRNDATIHVREIHDLFFHFSISFFFFRSFIIFILSLDLKCLIRMEKFVEIYIQIKTINFPKLPDISRRGFEGRTIERLIISHSLLLKISFPLTRENTTTKFITVLWD